MFTCEHENIYMVSGFPNNENGQLGVDECEYKNIYIATQISKC
jgi:hypothetical protein